MSGAPAGKGASLVSVLLFPSNGSPGTLVKPFRFELFHEAVGDAPDDDLAKRDWILERTIQVKLFTGFQSNFAAGGGGGGPEQEDSISLEVSAEDIELICAFCLRQTNKPSNHQLNPHPPSRFTLSWARTSSRQGPTGPSGGRSSLAQLI